MRDEEPYELLIGKNIPDGIQRIETDDPSKIYVEFKLDATQTEEGSLGEKFLRYVFQKFANSYIGNRHNRDQHTTRDFENKTATVLVSKDAIKELKNMAAESSDLRSLR